MSLADFLPVAVAVGAVLACGLEGRLASAAQPVRLELADRGEALLADPTVPADVREHVKFLLDRAFSFRLELIFAVIAMPFLLVYILVRHDLTDRMLDDYSALSPDVRTRFNDVMRLHERVTLANHPILTFIYSVELALFLPFVILAVGLIRARVPARLDHQVVIRFIEANEKQFRGWRAEHAQARVPC